LSGIPFGPTGIKQLFEHVLVRLADLEERHDPVLLAGKLVVGY
jgi:hypothetical protein